MKNKNTFERFPQKDTCPLCNTNEDKECFLMPMDGTEENDLCQAQPVHLDCMTKYASSFRLSKTVGVIYINI